MDYEEIINEHHDQYISDIITIINANPENKKMNFFIETIMQSNKEEYQLLCNALYKFITPQGGGMTTKRLDNEYLNLKGGTQKSCEDLKDYIKDMGNPETVDETCKIKNLKQHRTKVHPDKYREECKDEATEITQKINECIKREEESETNTNPLETIAVASAAAIATQTQQQEPSNQPQQQEPSNQPQQQEPSNQPQQQEPINQASATQPSNQESSSSESSTQNQSQQANRLIEKLKQIKSPIQIPHKNKLLIDEQFGLNSEDIKYKYYLSFYIIDAINNITVFSGGS